MHVYNNLLNNITENLLDEKRPYTISINLERKLPDFRLAKNRETIIRNLLFKYEVLYLK